MKRGKFLWSGLLIILLASCGAPKLITTGKTDAATFETAGNYKQAVDSWTKYFNDVPVEEVSGNEFAHAAKTAFQAGNLAMAKAWFDQARYKNYSEAEMYETLAKIYKEEDNLSKELSALESYIEKYGTSSDAVNARLFALYSEIDSNDKALEMWGKMSAEAKSTEDALLNYFKANKSLENTEVCDSVANAILELNPDDITALEWNAKKYYWAGQNRYKREMDKYNQKKTTKTYNLLLKELDLVTADFKKALPYLNKLWEIEPGKEYAGYLANIYALFGDEKKTNYYKNYRK
jgi:tetratricopeptide (TPR) repeat protein